MSTPPEDLRAALTAYIQQNQASLYRLAFRYLGREADALDAVQEAIVHAFVKLHTLREPAYLRTWFTRILINECLAILRRRKRVQPDANVSNETLFTHDPDQADAWALNQAVDALPVKYRSVILLRYFEDMKIEEVAQTLHWNLNTTKSRLYKALALLKTSVGKEWE